MVAKQQQNQGGELSWARTEPTPGPPQLVAETKVVAAQRPKMETWFKPKKGSLFPAKRKLVKTMFYESIVKFVASVLCPHRLPPPSAAQPCQPEPDIAHIPCLSKPTIPNAKKCKQILPHPKP